MEQAMEKQTQGERMVVALDASPQSLAVLRAAVQLAAGLQAESQVIFVEDANLLRLCHLPFGQEVSLFSATARQLDSRGMERQLRALAQSLQSAMAQIATAQQVRWSFRVTRGSLAEELLAAAADAQFLGLARFEQSLGRPVDVAVDVVARRTPRPIFILGKSGRLEWPLTLLYTSSEQANRALELAIRLARQTGQPLNVFAPGAGKTTVEALAQQLAEAGVAANLTAIADASHLGALLQRARPGTVILPAAEVDLLGQLTGSVIVVP
jgi:nucleotide-binding universal stress UspA family protein